MANNGNLTLKRALEATRRSSEERIPMMEFVRKEEDLATIISKLHRPAIQPSYDDRGNRSPRIPDTSKIKELASATSNNISDSQTVMQMLPDIELAAQVLISSVLSPKDMMTTEIIYTAPDDLMSPELKAALLLRIRQYFETDYKIKPLLPRMLRDILFETGSYPIMVIPENSVDDVINGYTRYSLESLEPLRDRASGMTKSLGLLGSPVATRPTREVATGVISLESLEVQSSVEQYNPVFELRPYFTPEERAGIEDQVRAADTYISVTDNYNILKMPKLSETLKRASEQRAVFGEDHLLNFSLESEAIELNDRELTGLIYKERSSDYRPIVALKTDDQLKRRMIGVPLIMHLPSESVIPVYTPGEPEKQIGYFVLLDNFGNPIELTKDRDHYRDLSARLDSNGSFPSAMLQKVKSSMTGFSCSDKNHLDYASSVYGEMIEADLLARLRNGRYGNGVAIAKKEEIYRIMLARSLAKQNTQLLWVPISLMTYFAIRYNASGIGKSLLDDMKILTSLRAMTSLANVLATLKNSIARTGVRIKFDANDPNPQKTLDIIYHEILRSRQQAIPLGTNNPSDISDWFTRAGFEITYEGHPGMPDVGIEFEDKSNNVAKIDTELDDYLRKSTAMGLGLSPETIDSTLQPEFATSVVTNNILLSKRVINIQDEFVPHLSDHTRKVVVNTESLMNDLFNELDSGFEKIALTDKIIEKAKGNAKIKKLVIRQVLKDFIAGLNAELPRPDSVSIENQKAAMDAYEGLVDKMLDYYVHSDMFSQEVAGEAATHIGAVRAIIKGYFMRRWCAENGVGPEFSDITSTMEDGKPAADIYASQIELIKGIVKSMSKLFVGLAPVKIAGDKIMEGLNVEPGEIGYSSGSSDTGGSDDGFGGGFDDSLDQSIPGMDNQAEQNESDEENSGTSEEQSSSTTTTQNEDGSTTTTTESTSSSNSVGF